MEEQVKELKVIDKRMDIPEETMPVDQGNGSVNAVVMMAMQKGYEPAFIEKMLDLQERFEANEARKAFYQAVADFKRNPPEVLKDKENSQFSKGDKKAMYVSLGNLVKTVNPALGEHGLSASWEINQAEKLVKVSCKLSHRFGHSETVTMEAPPDISGGNAKNPIQQIKSTVTYLRAATFEAVTGIAATEEANIDDDGNGAETEYISSDQVIEINDLIKEKGLSEAQRKKFLELASADSVEQVLSKSYGKAVAWLKAVKYVEKTLKERQPGEDDE